MRGSPVGARRSEPEVSVWTNSLIVQGSLCYPFQGTIRLDKLEVYGHLDEDDVSTRFFKILQFLLTLNGGSNWNLIGIGLEN